jgi:hypothetical protein
MSHGIRVLQSDGQVFDETIAAVTLMDVFTIAADTLGTLIFPALVGRQLLVVRGSASATAFGMHSVSISYPGGVPTVDYAPTGGPAPHTATQLMVFVR